MQNPFLRKCPKVLQFKKNIFFFFHQESSETHGAKYPILQDFFHTMYNPQVLNSSLFYGHNTFGCNRKINNNIKNLSFYFRNM